MTGIKIYDDAHRGVKLEAAKSGRTVPGTASTLIRYALSMIEAGKIDLGKMEAAEERIGKKLKNF